MVTEKIEPIVLSVPEAGKMLGLSRATAYLLANQGVIPTLRLGHRLVVPRKKLNEMLDRAGEPKEA